MVRITNSMMLRRYKSNISANTERMDKIGLQVSTFRKYQKGSEDPMSALRALQVRRSLESLYQESENINMADTILTQTEIAAKAVKDCADRAVELALQGRNDTMSDDDREIIANDLKNIQAELLKTLNTQISGKYIFGGANTKSPPFELRANDDFEEYSIVEVYRMNEDGEGVWEEKEVKNWMYSRDSTLYYMGVKDEPDGIVFNEVDSISELDIKDVNYDVGLGIRYSDYEDEYYDNTSQPDASSIFNVYTHAVEFIGYGKDNLYNLIGDLADAFKDGNMELIDGYLDGEFEIPSSIDSDLTDAYLEDNAAAGGIFAKLQSAQLKVLIGIVTVGENSNFINYLKEKNESSIFVMEELQNKLEVVEPDQAIMDYKMQEVIYQACLQMGNYILQPSLMSYLK